MAALTLRQAADLCGRSRSTIHRAVESGKLSAKKDETGAWRVDPAELARVFTWAAHEQQNGQDRTPNEHPSPDAALLSLKVTMLEQQLAREQETVQDLRKRLDKAEERLLALTPPPAPAEPQQPKRGLLGRLAAALKG